jgi:hypothetical protein
MIPGQFAVSDATLRDCAGVPSEKRDCEGVLSEKERAKEVKTLPGVVGGDEIIEE